MRRFRKFARRSKVLAPEALAASLAGFCASVLVTCLIALALYWNNPLATWVERAGSDLGMRWLSAWPGAQAHAPLPSRHNFLLVDIDRTACEAFETDPGRCRAGRQVPPRLLLAIAKAASAGGASAIAIDVEPPVDAAERQWLADQLTLIGGPPIVAPLNTRPIALEAGERASYELELDPRQDLIPGWGRGQLRLAEFSIGTDPEAHDGVVRQFASSMRGRLPDGHLRTVPTVVPLLLAMEDPARRAEVDCTYYGIGCQGKVKPLPPTADYRIVFSLRSLGLAKRGAGQPGMASEAQVARLENRYANVYQHRFASDLLETPLTVSSDPRFYADASGGKIVFIGSSAYSALDIHQTPLGPMSGAEVIVNAMRSMQASEAKRLKAEGLSRGYRVFLDTVSKIGSALLGLPSLFLTWLVLGWLIRRRRHMVGWRRFLFSLAVPSVFAMGLLSAAILEVWLNASEIRDRFAAGENTDFLTPILLLGVEGYAEASIFLVERLKHLILHALEKLDLNWRNFRGHPPS